MPMGKSYLAHYLSETIVCVGLVNFNTIIKLNHCSCIGCYACYADCYVYFLFRM